MAKQVKKVVRHRNTVDKHTTYYPDSLKAVEAYAKKKGCSLSLAVDRCLRLCFQLDKEINKGAIK